MDRSPFTPGVLAVPHLPGHRRGRVLAHGAGQLELLGGGTS
ncbi:hypothetical protein [Kutzneria albida]|nr:hypothetical protein [Kutzneria albida]